MKTTLLIILTALVLNFALLLPYSKFVFPKIQRAADNYADYCVGTKHIHIKNPLIIKGRR